MLSLNYTRTEEYKAIIEQYIEAMNKLKQYTVWQTDKQVVRNFTIKTQKALKSRLSSYLDFNINNAQAKMFDIKKRYTNAKPIIDNPQVELLNRQDFDLKLSMMDANQVKDMLKDESINFSDYELLKIQSVYKDDMGIDRLVREQKSKNTNAFENDPDYIRYAEDLAVLRQVKVAGLGLVYLPDDNEQGYQTFNLELYNHGMNSQQIDERINTLKKLLTTIKNAGYPSITPEFEQLKQEQPSKKEKTLEFEEFDERIFKGSPKYDTVVRFKYLRERFTDDQNGGRWDYRRDDYNVISHWEYLENKQQQRLLNDKNYAEAYHKAEQQSKQNSKDDHVIKS